MENQAVSNQPAESVKVTNSFKTNEPIPEQTDRQMLAEILENSRKTKNYMKWQLIITVALVVIPLLASLAIIPYAMKSFSAMYDISAGLDSNPASQIQDLLK